MTNPTREPLTAPVVSSPANSLMTAEEFFAKHQHDHVELVRGMVQEMAMADTIMDSSAHKSLGFWVTLLMNMVLAV